MKRVDGISRGAVNTFPEIIISVKITIKVLRDSNLYKKRAQGQKVKGKYASSDYPSIIFFLLLMIT